MAKRPEARVTLDRILRDGQTRNSRKVFRDKRRKVVLVNETAVDFNKLRKSGRALSDVARRIRLFSADMKREEAVFLAPTELTGLTGDEMDTAVGLELPLGTVIKDEGLWLRYRPGVEEVGVNDRGEIILRERKNPDPDSGPVSGSVYTRMTSPSKRLVARITEAEHAADRKEAEQWLKLFAGLSGKRPTKFQFKCAGIDGQHRGNVPHLHRTTQLSLYDPRDIEMVRIASLVAYRYRKVRKSVPKINVLSVSGLPNNTPAWSSLRKKVLAKRKNSLLKDLPEKIQESRFYDAEGKQVLPGTYFCLSPLKNLPDEMTVITINTDSHDEIRRRGVQSPLSSIMTIIDVISARAGVAVLNTRGTATAFLGPTGSGKTTACTFWAGNFDGVRRREMSRRYEVEIRKTPDAGRLGEAGIQKEIDRIMSGVGVLCHEDWVQILKLGAGHWVFWPTERMFYARTAGFPGLQHVLSENGPVLENVVADLGASGDAGNIGRVTHGYGRERIFYDPEWNNLLYDRSERKITATVLFDKEPGADWCVRKLAPKDAVDRILAGLSHGGAAEPLFNSALDFCAVLTDKGVTGRSLLDAYETAKDGRFDALGAGDGKLGEAIFEKLDSQVKLWMDYFREIDTWAVNSAFGLELTQDINWVLSQHPDALGEKAEVGIDQFRDLMKDRFGVRYGPAGQWSHIT